jgi:hypothetical protein
MKPVPHVPLTPQCSVCGAFGAFEAQQISAALHRLPAHATACVGLPLLLDPVVLGTQPDVLEPVVPEPVVPEPVVPAGTQVPFEVLHDDIACAAVVAPSAYQVSSPKSLVQVPIALAVGQLVPLVPFSDAHIIIWVATSLGERPR